MTSAVDSDAGTGAVGQQLAARISPFDSAPGPASHREQASARAGFFMGQCILPACADGACTRRITPRVRIETKRRAFMSPQHTRARGRCDNWFLGTIGETALVLHESRASGSRLPPPFPWNRLLLQQLRHPAILE